MSKFSRFVVLVTALASLFAVMSSTAGATTWTNTGATSFAATGPGGILAVTGSGGTNNLTCTGATATGTAAAVFTTVSGTVTFTPCSISGTATHVACTYTLTPLTFASGVTTGSAAVTCTAKLAATGTPLCHIAGSTPGHYINPAGSTAGRLTVTASSSLVVTPETGTGSGSCSSLLGTASSGFGHLSEQTFTVSGSGPVIAAD
ncbi:MAG TPA: hypothetical protein VFG42_01510 [Baekduia sp.]|uniref:hypothetical protein n=1 Tax=Baekduia sp. TaxID=2600305 RepID=UPI002D779B8B|nr:hypothetical protein [Baekduia sp.]HET6505440.1 hypothetical protein [Baekduia sp.]